MTSRSSFLCLSLLIVALCASTSWGAEPPALDPDLPYQAERHNPVTYDVELSAIVTAPYKTKLLRVWMPIPQSDRGQEVLSSKFSTQPAELAPAIHTEPLYGNKFAYFEFKNPEGGHLVRHDLKIKVWELRWHLEPDKVHAVESWPDSFSPYRRSEEQSVVVDDRFRNLVQQIVASPKGPLQDMMAVIGWADSNLKYSHDTASLRASSVHALEHRAGHCSDYHGLCASLGRALGYPTRVTYGINPFPKASPSHCKLEAYLPPYGWVSFDVSETQKLTAAIRDSKELEPAERERLIAAARQRLATGFRDNTWFLQTKGTDYELAPKAAKAVPVVRTIYAEADGVPLEDPDPSSAEQTKFSWMTIHKYKADKPAPYPFKDFSTLEAAIQPDSNL